MALRPERTPFDSRRNAGAFDLLKNQYDKNGIVIFLGLGASSCSGLPDWSELTERVLSTIPNGLETFHELHTAGYSLPAILSWARCRLGEEPFAECLRKQLYLKLGNEFKSGQDGEALKISVAKTNPTLAAVAALTAKCTNDGIVANSRIRAVLTTNADHLLQQYARRAFGGAEILRTVDRASAGLEAGRTNLYHLHGLMRFDGKYDRSKEAPDQLVFTDLQYYSAYQDQAAIFTYTPLFLLREYTFLFIGTRMTDDNIRRLLHWSRCELERGYKAEGLAGLPDSEQIRHFALMKDAGSLRSPVEELLKQLGVIPIWYHSHIEVPRILAKLYGDQEAWSQLFAGDCPPN